MSGREPSGAGLWSNALHANFSRNAFTDFTANGACESAQNHFGREQGHRKSLTLLRILAVGKAENVETAATADPAKKAAPKKAAAPKKGRSFKGSLSGNALS